jgi:hypothetical protein
MKKSVFLINGLLLTGILFLMVSCLPDRSNSRFPDFLSVYSREKLQEAFPDGEFIVGFGLDDTDLRLSLFDAAFNFLEKTPDVVISGLMEESDNDFSELSRMTNKQHISNSLIIEAKSDEYAGSNYERHEMLLKIEGIKPGNQFVFIYYLSQSTKNNQVSLNINVKDEIEDKSLFNLSVAEDEEIKHVDEDSFNKAFEKISNHLNAIEGVVCGVLKETGEIFIACKLSNLSGMQAPD